MRVFVAGASGAIGSRLVPRLIERGHEVVGTCRSAANAGRVGAHGAEAVVLDLLDAGAVRRAVLASEPDAVVHQATALAGLHEWLPVLVEVLGAKPPRRVPRWLRGWSRGRRW